MVHKKDQIIIIYPANNIYSHQKGCLVELAQVEINNQKYWSINFESWSDNDDSGKDLPHYLDFFLEHLDINTAIFKYLNPKQALSYPQFLLSLP